MKRIHLFEFEDQKWFPAFLRNYITHFLQFLSDKAKVYQPVADEVQSALEKSNTSEIIDLGSGGGGGLLWLSRELKKVKPDLKITLTDFYPNIAAFEYTKKQSDIFNFCSDSIDARNVPESLKGLRTLFLSFHHFKPNDAKKIIQNAVDEKQPIAVFEIQGRDIPSIFAMLLSPISVLLFTPFIKPFNSGRIVFTYLLPIVPLVVLWDGIVSCLRTYSLDEMKNLVNTVNNKEQFEWKFEKKKSKTGFVIFMIGIPEKQD